MTSAERDRARDAAARAALARVAPGMVVGLGTGDTAARFVAALAEARLPGVRGVPTSRRTAEDAARRGIALVELDAVGGVVDLAVDGADQVDRALRMVKGGGGAQLHEKIVATAARHFVVIVDEEKVVPRLHRALPLEVIPAAVPLVTRWLAEEGVQVVRRVDHAGAPLVTDEGNALLEASFDLANPEALAARLDAMVGVVEHGLFLGLAERVLVGHADGTVVEL